MGELHMKSRIDATPWFGVAFLALVIVLAIAPAAEVSAQVGDDWVSLSADAGRVTFALPSSFIVHNEGKRIRLFADSDGATFSISKEETDNAKRSARNIEYPKKGSLSNEKADLGEFYIRRFNYEPASGIVTSIFIGSPTSLYVISVTANNTENAAVGRFLSSIKAGGKTIFNEVAGNDPVALPEVEISGLATSRSVIDALNVPRSTGNVVKFGKVEKEAEDLSTNFSRRLIIVSRPKASYTDAARIANKQGTIRARIEFLKSGQIGNVLVDSRLDLSLSTNVANAIRQIKFIPAEIDGRPVTVTKVVEYGFTIY
jgi:hypothetical protein